MNKPSFNENEIKTYYATISSNQSYNGKSGPGCVKINADSESQARRIIHNATNGRWAFMYDSLEAVHPADRIILGTLGYLL